MVYYEQEPPPQDERPGCMDVWLITRTVFGILLWPLVVLFAIVIDLAVIAMLLVTNAPFALIPIALTVAAIWLASRWERGRFREPPDV